MKHLIKVCQSFICTVELTVENLPRWLALSAKHDLDAAVERCLAFVAADGHFTAIRKCVCFQCHVLNRQTCSPLAVRMCGLKLCGLKPPCLAICRHHKDEWMHDLPGALIVKLFMPHVVLLETTLSGVKVGLESAMENSVKPTTEPHYPEGSRRHYQDRDRQTSTVLHRATVEAVHYSMACYCNYQLEQNAALEPGAMQQVLANSTPELPLPPTPS